jgi:hypothetical protein
MNRRILTLALLLVPGAAFATVSGENDSAAASSSAPQRPATLLPARLRQVRERIDTLFQRRDQPTSVPEASANPFRPPPSQVKTDTYVPDTDLVLLQRAVTSLKVGGTVDLGERQHIVINAKPYQPGDTVKANVKGQPIVLCVRDFTRRDVTFTFHNEELTLRF